MRPSHHRPVQVFYDNRSIEVAESRKLGDRTRVGGANNLRTIGVSSRGTDPVKPLVDNDKWLAESGMRNQLLVICDSSEDSKPAA